MPEKPSTARSLVVLSYSQTGQLDEVVDALTRPLEKAGWRIRRVPIRPREPFPFPWPVTRFFGVFPAVLDPETQVELLPVDAEQLPGPDELVLFAFQVWYLSPSLPMKSVLTGLPEALAGRDVVSLVACRNMWYSAAGTVRGKLTAAGARYRGTVAASDTSPQLVTFVTTLRWLLTGNRAGFAGLPRAGVGDDELARLGRLGEALADTTDDEFTSVLRDADAAPVMPLIAAADLAAGRAFRRWAVVLRLASRAGALPRRILLGAFVFWLGLAIGIGLPVLTLLRLVAHRRFDEIVRAKVVQRLAPSGRAPEGGDRHAR